MSDENATEDRTAAVGRRAYEIWESEGRPEGRSTEHWAAAEAELRAPRAPTRLHGQDTALGPDDSLPIGRVDAGDET